MLALDVKPALIFSELRAKLRADAKPTDRHSPRYFKMDGLEVEITAGNSDWRHISSLIIAIYNPTQTTFTTPRISKDGREGVHTYRIDSHGRLMVLDYLNFGMGLVPVRQLEAADKSLLNQVLPHLPKASEVTAEAVSHLCAEVHHLPPPTARRVSRSLSDFSFTSRSLAFEPS
jgi:hypothetical protein